MKYLSTSMLVICVLLLSGCFGSLSNNPQSTISTGSQSTGMMLSTGSIVSGNSVSFDDANNNSGNNTILPIDNIDHSKTGTELSLEQLLSGEDLSPEDKQALQEITKLLQGEGEKTTK